MGTTTTTVTILYGVPDAATTTTTVLYGATTTTTVYVAPKSKAVSSYTCNMINCVHLPVNKGVNVVCKGDLSTCTEEFCCEEYATCDTFACTALQVNLATNFCKGGRSLSIAD